MRLRTCCNTFPRPRISVTWRWWSDGEMAPWQRLSEFRLTSKCHQMCINRLAVSLIAPHQQHNCLDWIGLLISCHVAHLWEICNCAKASFRWNRCHPLHNRLIIITDWRIGLCNQCHSLGPMPFQHSFLPLTRRCEILSLSYRHFMKQNHERNSDEGIHCSST